MKKVILPVVIILYVFFIAFMLVPSGHHYTSVYEIVVSHLTDHPIENISITNQDNIIVSSVKTINNSISYVNNTYLKNKFFGIIDMKITRWVLMMWLALSLMVVIFITLGQQIKKAQLGSTSRWVNLWEVLIGVIHDDIVAPFFDHKYIKIALPYFATLFFFLLFCNVLGLLPGFSTATGNLAVTAALAVFTLLGIVGVGFIKQGPLFIITGIVPGGVPKAIFPLLWLIELVGLLIKPFSLTIRLFANMLAGHIVIIIFLYLSIMFQNYFVAIGGVMGALMIYALELLVVLIQAYIFTTLSAIFISSSMHAH